jgi:hypothetical protein
MQNIIIPHAITSTSSPINGDQRLAELTINIRCDNLELEVDLPATGFNAFEMRRNGSMFQAFTFASTLPAISTGSN